MLVLVPVLAWCQAGLWTLTASSEVKTDAHKVQAARCTPPAIPAAAAWHNPSRHCPSKTVRARELKFWENVHPPPSVTYPVSYVRCHVSGVPCQVSGVRCWSVTNLFFLIFLLLFGQSCEASWWRVCYQRGLPVYIFIRHLGQVWSFCMYSRLLLNLGTVLLQANLPNVWGSRFRSPGIWLLCNAPVQRPRHVVGCITLSLSLLSAYRCTLGALLKKKTLNLFVADNCIEPYAELILLVLL